MLVRRLFMISIATFALCLGLPTTGLGQSDQTKSDIEQLKKDVDTLEKVQKAIIMELRAIRARMPSGDETDQSPNPQTVNLKVDITDVPQIGSTDSPVAIVEFSDFECPYCAHHFEATLPRIEEDYIQTGKVLYVIRDFPIAKLHPHALKAAEAGGCAADQGKFWQMHSMLFSNQGNLEPADMIEYAGALHLDRDAFRQCLSSGVHAVDVQHSIAYGAKLGVSATPTFFIGRLERDRRTVHAVAELPGAYPFAIFKETVDKLLNAHE